MNFEPLLRRALTPGGHDLNNLKSTIYQKAYDKVQAMRKSEKFTTTTTTITTDKEQNLTRKAFLSPQLM